MKFIKTTIVAVMMISLFLVLVGCGVDNEINQRETEIIPEQTKESAAYYQISQDQAKQMMDQGDVIVIDVREADEFEQGYIKDAVLSPVGNIQNDIEDITKQKDTKLLIYCRSGNRSKIAASTLANLGYTEVYEFGGINTWEYEIIYKEGEN